MRIYSLVVILCLGTSLLSSQEEQHPKLESIQTDSIKIVVLGSSTAEGIGPLDSREAWVNQLRAYLLEINPANKVINLAKGGYTTYHIIPTGSAQTLDRPSPDENRNITNALSRYPDAIIINLPSNDAAAGYPVIEQLPNYDRIMSLANAAQIPVWISTTQPRNLSDSGRQNLMDMRDSTFARFKDKAIDFWSGIAMSDGTINPGYDSGDGIHLNAAGHTILLKRVMESGLLKFVTPQVKRAIPVLH
jgi:lysophospholipase L1-like esterase